MHLVETKLICLALPPPPQPYISCYPYNWTPELENEKRKVLKPYYDHENFAATGKSLLKKKKKMQRDAARSENTGAKHKLFS